jgi:cytochrome c biogenesis protein CcmG/thiol:disulfide interchange protein DsbE
MSNTRPPARPAASTRPRQARTAKKSSSTMPWLVAGLVIVVGLALLVAVLGTGGGGDDAAGNETADVTVTGESLPGTAGGSGLISPASDPAVGKTVPALSGSTPSGSAITFAPTGRPAVYLFAAHWCPHCQAELPKVQKWLNDGSLPRTAEIRTISTSVDASRGNFPPSAWLTRINWANPVMVDSRSGQAGQAFGLESFPYMLFVDANGVVKQRATGEIGLEAWKAGMALIGGSAG